MGPRQLRKIALLVVCVMGLTFASGALADLQVYKVVVSPRLELIAPKIWMIKAYPGTGSADIVFPPQVWRARGNATRGCTVTFETSTAFRHTTTPTSKRDAKLDISSVSAVSGPGVWTTTLASSTTNYRTGNEQARVRVSSNNSGEAQIRVSVTFLTGAPGTLQEGDYQTTVVGTITAN